MKQNLLQQHFPMIRTRSELETIIRQTPALCAEFFSWSDDQQQEFLDFCTGERGVKILYDSFFKEIFHPEYAPQRLEDFLSCIMGQTIKILQVLPNDSTRLADEASLLSTDIVVELEDHSIANVEVQKIGYLFPGQRSACYTADLLLRQYKRLRDKHRKKFTYKMIHSVYSIVLFERSTAEFHAYPDKYLHYFCQRADTGLQLELLQKYYFIPLDIFNETIHNKGINTALDAWLTFLTTDDPEMIWTLIQKFPKFKNMYADIYELCRNIEGVMHMFSKELLELDRNTVKYMIDEMQTELNQTKLQLGDTTMQLGDMQQQLDSTQQQLGDTQQQLTDARLLNMLTSLLMEDNRIEDLKQALADEEYQKQLLTEYHLI